MKLSGLVMVGLLSLCASACQPPQRRVMFTEHTAGKAGSETITSFSTPADLRLAFLRPDGSKDVYCSEPMPDVALGSDASGSASLAGAAALSQAASTNSSLAQENSSLRQDLAKAIDAYEKETKKQYSSSTTKSGATSVENSGSGSVNLAASARLAITVAELGGRSQQVLLAREFLYRICEARANGFFQGPQAYIDMQMNALRLIESIASVPRQSAEAEKLAANSELVKQVTAYNTQRQADCEAKQKACDASAANDVAKKECVKARKDCVDAIKPLEAPPVKGLAEATPKGPGNSMLTSPTEEPAPGKNQAPAKSPDGKGTANPPAGGSSLTTPVQGK